MPTRRARLTRYSSTSAPSATQVAITTQPSGAADAVAFSVQPIVEIRDGSNVKVSSSTASVTAAIASGSGVLSGTLTVAAVAGVATFTNLKITGAGTDTIVFTSSGLASATSGSIVVAPVATQAYFGQAWWGRPFFGASLFGLPAPPRNAINAAIAAIGTSSIDALYHTSLNLAVSGSDMVTWDDVRGPTFGVQLLPNGGAGGTAPIVSGGCVVTNGTSSYISNAVANAIFRVDSNPQAIAIWGEFTGNPVHWGGIESADDATYQLIKNAGSGVLEADPNTYPTSKAQPASGVHSLLFINRNGIYAAFSETAPKTFFEWVGRCSSHKNTAQTAATGYLRLGSTLHGGPDFGPMKIRGILVMNRMMTAADRAAIEALVTDATLGDNVDLYGQSDSKGLVLCLGDSTTAGNVASVVVNSFPVGTSGTTWPSRLQVLINSNSKPIDVVNQGYSGIALSEFLTNPAGCPTNFVDDLCAQFSAARRAKGLKELFISWVTNDIFFVADANAAYANLTLAIGKAHAAGAKVAVFTMPPRGGYWGTGKETARLLYNTKILGNVAGADATLDLRTILDPANSNYAFLQDPTSGVSGVSDPITSNTTYYHDTVHIEDIGLNLIASAVYSTISGLL